MKLQFESYEEGFGSELKCPACGSNYLHHEKVEIFERSEDEAYGLHVTVENGMTTTNTNLEGNPSRRRDGLTIHFSCEGCDAKPILSVSQHKGNTWIDIN